MTKQKKIPFLSGGVTAMKKRCLCFIAWILLINCLLIPSEAKAAQNKLKLNVKKLDMTIDSNFQLRIYNKKKKQTADFVSSNPAIVSVESVSANTKNAVLRASGIGVSQITVTVTRKKRPPKILKCRVAVFPEAVSIKFMKKNVKLKPGRQFHTSVIIKPSASREQPIFESSDPNVASITPLGVITAVSPGTVTIRATLLSANLSTVCKVTVKPPAKPKRESGLT